MSLICYDGDRRQPLLLLAHGAGADSRSEFMQRMTELLVEQGVCVGRFDFAYMERARAESRRMPPDRMPKLLQRWQAVLDESEGSCVIGGKSMGGRAASMLMADEAFVGGTGKVAGVVCLGYPFYAPGKQDKPRVGHLAQLRVEQLVIQGTRDPMGSKGQVEGWLAEAPVSLSWLEDGDHDLKPRVRSGYNHEQHMLLAARQAAEFVRRCLSQHD